MTVDLSGDEIGLIQEAIHTKQIDLYIKMTNRSLKEYEEYKTLNEKLDKVLEQNEE